MLLQPVPIEKVHDNVELQPLKWVLAKKTNTAEESNNMHDYRIFNLAVRYGKSNPHSSIGYYIHPRLSKIIADWIGQPVISQGTP